MGNTSDWPVEALWPNPDNPRRNIKGEPDFEGLVASIKSQGIINPLLINSEGMILAGHRRHEAALEAELKRVPVRVLGDETNHALIPLIENLQRSDLAVLEVAEYLRAYSRESNAPLVAISEVTGISASTISKYLKLADAPVEVKERIERDEIPLGAAFELLRHDEAFIRQVVNTPTLTKQIVREQARAMNVRPLREGRSYLHSTVVGHLECAIRAIEELLAASPDDALSIRYKRWLNILGDDLEDAKQADQKKKAEPAFRGMVDRFQRQPKKAVVGWKTT